MLADAHAAHVSRHPDAHTIGPACERQPLSCDPADAVDMDRDEAAPPNSLSDASIDKLLGRPDAHTIGTACERQPLGRDPAGAAPEAVSTAGLAPPVSVSRLAAIRQVLGPSRPPSPGCAPDLTLLHSRVVLWLDILTD